MGAWGYGIFEDDIACDIQDDFNSYLEEGLASNEATERILKEYIDETEADQSDIVVVYLALAVLQMEHNELQSEIKEHALDIIENDKGLEIWKEAGEEAFQQRKKVVWNLRIKLLGE